MEARVLTLSSKGQIVLPAELRRQFDLETGDKLVAYASGDVIMLKRLTLPSAQEFRAALDEAQAWAAEAGYTEEDVADIVKSVRAKKHNG